MKYKLTVTALFILAAFVFSPSPARAQEGEPVVVDEVIAQVNDGVVTLSQLKSEMKERVDTLKQNGMTEQQANAEVEKHKAELIAMQKETCRPVFLLCATRCRLFELAACPPKTACLSGSARHRRRC